MFRDEIRVQAAAVEILNELERQAEGGERRVLQMRELRTVGVGLGDHLPTAFLLRVELQVIAIGTDHGDAKADSFIA